MIALSLSLVAVLQAQTPACADSARVVGDTAREWVRHVEHLACENRRLADDIQRAMTLLQARANTQAPTLVARILAEPPRGKPTGYGLLPEIIADSPESPVPLTESRFAVKSLLDAAAAERSAAAALLSKAASDSAALEPMVRELERLKPQRNWLEGSVGYHRFWQRSANDARAFFAEKNALVARAVQLRDMQRRGGDTAAMTSFQLALAADVAPFVKTPGLAWRLNPDGMRVLHVDLVTDITDSAFLATFARAVASAWSDSPAALARHFRVELVLKRIRPDSIYPEGVPALGSAINEAAHIARFPKGAMVLTTGGTSIHAYVGQYVQLGTAPIGPRILAHEFGHLLGFADGYLRGSEGSLDDPYGFTIVEWTGILNDMMGAPGIGRVTGEMIERLVASYAPANAGTPPTTVP